MKNELMKKNSFKDIDEFFKERADQILPEKDNFKSYFNFNKESFDKIRGSHWVTYLCNHISIAKEKLLPYCKKKYGQEYTIEMIEGSGPGGLGDKLFIRIGKIKDLVDPRMN